MSRSTTIALPLIDLLNRDSVGEIGDDLAKILIKAKEDLYLLNQWVGPYPDKNVSLEAILESAAINVQFNYIRSEFGDEGVYLFAKYLRTNYPVKVFEKYYSANKVLVDELGGGEFLSDNIANTILFASLCGKPKNEDKIWRPSEVFQELVNYLKDKVEPHSQAAHEVYENIDALFRGMALN